MDLEPNTPWWPTSTELEQRRSAHADTDRSHARASIERPRRAHAAAPERATSRSSSTGGGRHVSTPTASFTQRIGLRRASKPV